MNKTSFLLIASIFSAVSAQADDTEIYGAAAIDEDSRVNANVLFIVDTSGSMGDPVQYFENSYDPNESYTERYDEDEFFISTNARTWEGIDISRLETQWSTDCEETVSTLSTTGKITGRYNQWRNGWRRGIRDDSNGVVRCNGDNSTNAQTLYSGHYLNYYHDGDNVVETTRMEAVKDIVSDLTYSLKDVNLGLMRFDGSYQASHGGAITVNIDDIETSGPLIRSSVDTYSPYWGTPLTETLYEAQRYFAGESVEFGNDTSPTSDSATKETGNTNKYSSPIEQTCQKNHIIYLTDGAPSVDDEVNSEVISLISGLDLPSALASNCSNHSEIGSNGRCLDELAYYMSTVDQSDSLAGTQVINTHVINAFGDIEFVDFLEDTARYGGGGYYEAEDPSAVAEAINSIFLEILSTDSTFTAPAISVNAFNNSEHRDELFYALFKPKDSARWSGNLKKYRLGSDGKIYDKKGDLAIDASTGFFSSSSQDFWSTVDDEDGKDVTLGGISNLLNPASRTIYSNDSNDNISSFSSVASATTLGVDSSEVDELKQWIIGYKPNSNTEARHYIGDPLHSEPVVVTYGGTDEDPDSTIFFGTNEGMIHAIDTQSGEEKFAFLPRELHGIQDVLYRNTTPAGSRPYGMDGPISTWMYDLNSNNVIYNKNDTLEAGEHAYIYAGMRRGGRNYYALDVTNRDNPKLLFKIEGGSGDFSRLGQTWAEMTIAKIKFNGADRFVAFFTGGYDTNQDSNTTRENDSVGNAIYMVDAKTGERLWWASKNNANLNITDMKNSMPASVSAVDINGDGYVEYLYAADTGGRVFRIDINKENTGASDFAEGGVIAELADNTESGNRRFYNKPSVAIVKDKDFGDYLTIALGSGHRAHPILTTDVNNRFYVLKDFYPYGKPTSYSKTTEAAENKTSLSENENPSKTKIYNATSLMTGGKTNLTTDMRRIMAEGGGWYVKLQTNGEKGLSQATTFSGAVIFTTFSPSTGGSGNACEPDTGTSRVYALDQRWAMAAVDLDNDGDIDVNDSNKILTNSGIAPRPVVIYRKGGGKSITLGTESIDDSRFKESSMEQCNANNCYVTPNYWRENIKAYEDEGEPDTNTGG